MNSFASDDTTIIHSQRQTPRAQREHLPRYNPEWTLPPQATTSQRSNAAGQLPKGIAEGESGGSSSAAAPMAAGASQSTADLLPGYTNYMAPYSFVDSNPSAGSTGAGQSSHITNITAAPPGYTNYHDANLSSVHSNPSTGGVETWQSGLVAGAATSMPGYSACSGSAGSTGAVMATTSLDVAGIIPKDIMHMAGASTGSHDGGLASTSLAPIGFTYHGNGSEAPNLGISFGYTQPQDLDDGFNPMWPPTFAVPNPGVVAVNGVETGLPFGGEYIIDPWEGEYWP